MKQKVCIVVGTRPNFMKVAPLLREFEKRKILCDLIHTGQHYDQNMSKIFFDDLNIPSYNVIFLHTNPVDDSLTRVTNIMRSLQPLFLAEQYSCIIVVGDVDSTLAAALAAKFTNNKLVHIEAGLRSFNPNMPEEFNRILIDRMSDMLFVTEASGIKNLLRENISKRKIFIVGNIMIDNLVYNVTRLNGVKDTKDYGLVTLHRPANVDTKKSLEWILQTLSIVGKKIPLRFILHPRTNKKIIEFNLKHYFKQTGMHLYPATGPLVFLQQMIGAKFILTDSGGIQEEATYLQIPTLTLRNETERPITVTLGTNEIVGQNKQCILHYVDMILQGKFKKGKNIMFWDGQTSQRIVNILLTRGFIKHD